MLSLKGHRYTQLQSSLATEGTFVDMIREGRTRENSCRNHLQRGPVQEGNAESKQIAVKEELLLEGGG